MPKWTADIVNDPDNDYNLIKENIYHLDDPRNRNFDVYVYENNVMIMLEPDNKIELKVINGRTVRFGGE